MGLRLNLKKSYIIPLNSKGIEANKRLLESYPGSWSDMPVVYHAKCLGFMMGPEK